MLVTGRGVNGLIIFIVYWETETGAKAKCTVCLAEASISSCDWCVCDFSFFFIEGEKWERNGRRTKAPERMRRSTWRVSEPPSSWCRDNMQQGPGSTSSLILLFSLLLWSGPNCRHIKKGTDQTLLKKLTGSSDWTSCQECKHEDNKENTDTNQEPGEERETAAVWMCLKCGHRVSLLSTWSLFGCLTFFSHLNHRDPLLYQGCGRHSENQHAIKHYETPRSDPHCLVVSMDNWSVWWVWCWDSNNHIFIMCVGFKSYLICNSKICNTINGPRSAVIRFSSWNHWTLCLKC